MGAPKKYTQKTLKEAVDGYFDSITREVAVMERVPTGKKDAYGHEITKLEKVKNKLGKVAKVTEYLVPPTLGGLCLHLGIDNSTWSRWRDPVKYPEFKKVIAYVDQRLITWRTEQVLTQKNVRGIIWDLEVNFGCGKDQQPQNEEVRVEIQGGDEQWLS